MSTVAGLCESTQLDGIVVNVKNTFITVKADEQQPEKVRRSRNKSEPFDSKFASGTLSKCNFHSKFDSDDGSECNFDSKFDSDDGSECNFPSAFDVPDIPDTPEQLYLAPITDECPQNPLALHAQQSTSFVGITSTDGAASTTSSRTTQQSTSSSTHQHQTFQQVCTFMASPFAFSSMLSQMACPLPPTSHVLATRSFGGVDKHLASCASGKGHEKEQQASSVKQGKHRSSVKGGVQSSSQAAGTVKGEAKQQRSAGSSLKGKTQAPSPKKGFGKALSFFGKRWKMDRDENDQRTTVMIKNIPNNYTRENLLDLLHLHGYAQQYDFIYVPMDFHRDANLGYAFVNMTTAVAAKDIMQRFHGFAEWPGSSSDKTCEMDWGNPMQGFDAHVQKFRNSPVMHENVPDKFKPRMYVNGVPTPLPPPTKRLRMPRTKHCTEWTNNASAQ